MDLADQSSRGRVGRLADDGHLANLRQVQVEGAQRLAGPVGASGIRSRTSRRADSPADRYSGSAVKW